MAKTTVSRYEISSSSPELAHCLHCGEEITPSNIVVSQDKYFCCTGCSTVYELLHTLGLDNFYKIREEQNISQIERPIDFAHDEEYQYLNQKSFAEQYTNIDNPLNMTFYIEGIQCGACLWLIEKIPNYSEYIDSVSLDMSTNLATVKFTAEKKFSSFPLLVSRFGYKAHPVRLDEEALDLKKKENRKSLIRISIAAVCAGNIMLLSAAIYSGADGIFAEQFEFLNLILSLPVVTYCAYPFYKSVYSSLKARRLTVDIPIVFVVVVGFILSTLNYLKGTDQVYFDSVTAFIFLLLTSRYFLKSIQGRISNREPSKGLILGQNKILIWDNRNKQFFLEPIEILKSGQRVKVNYGERIPIDGMLLSDKAELNLSILTGENIPQTLFKNDMVYAGSILNSNEAVIKTINTGASTRIGKLLNQVEKDYRSKINNVANSDRFATIFTLAVGIIAVLSFLVIATMLNPSAALNRVMAFVLIACPCAFVFALPLTFGLSLNKSIEKGILVKNSKVFERLPETKNIFFDKTGTLTKGIYKILKWDKETLSDSDKAAILAIERKSNHPIARAISSQLTNEGLNLPSVYNYKYNHTKGIEADVYEQHYELYSDERINDNNELNELITSKIIIKKDGKLLSQIILGDSLKDDAKYVVNSLKEKGYRIHILSGDNENNVRNTATKLGVSSDLIYWTKTPEEKAEIVKQFKGTVMIGDGLNDASAFSNSDVGVSVQGSAEESLKVSDVYLLNNSLGNILDILSLASKTRSSINRNSGFSIAYNMLAGTLALFGYINPLTAAILMPISSVLLIGSSLYGYNSLNKRSQHF